MWRNHKIWIFSLIGFSIGLAFLMPDIAPSPRIRQFFPYNPSYENNLSSRICSRLGYAIGFLITPYLLLLAPQLVCRVRNKHWGGACYLRWFTGIWALHLGLAYLGAITGQRPMPKPNTTTPQPVESHVFAPQFSDYSVIFSRKPQITGIAVGDSPWVMEGLEARLSNTQEASFQRAEIFQVPKALSQSITKDIVLQNLRAVAANNGLKQPEYHWETTPLGLKVTLRGTKSLTRLGEQRNITYMGQIYVGRSSVLAITVGCFATDYPTPEISRFLASITTNPQ